MKPSKMAFFSLAPSLVLIVVFGSLSAVGISSARAEEKFDEGHPCAEYVKHCKAKDLTPGHGLWRCVAKEAKKSNNEVCIAKLKEGAKKMREHKKHKADAEPASKPDSKKEAE